MLLKIGLAAVAALVLFLVYVAFQSPDYVISREIAIQAPAEKIFPYLNSTKLADQWGPWKEVDPKAVMNYSGPEEGVGAQTSWDSPGQLGKATVTIVESVPLQKVALKLDYQKPMQMKQDAQYLIRGDGNQSIVTWKVTGQNNFMGRLMCVFMDMDKMVGGMFEKGLTNLKTLVEQGK